MMRSRSFAGSRRRLSGPTMRSCSTAYSDPRRNRAGNPGLSRSRRSDQLRPFPDDATCSASARGPRTTASAALLRCSAPFGPGHRRVGRVFQTQRAGGADRASRRARHRRDHGRQRAALRRSTGPVGRAPRTATRRASGAPRLAAALPRPAAHPALARRPPTRTALRLHESQRGARPHRRDRGRSCASPGCPRTTATPKAPSTGSSSSRRFVLLSVSCRYTAGSPGLSVREYDGRVSLRRRAVRPAGPPGELRQPARGARLA